MRDNRRFVPLAMAVIAAIWAPHGANAQTCEFPFGAKTFEIRARGQVKFEEVNKMNNWMTKRMNDESRALEAYYKKNPEKAVVDTIVVGDGLHGSIFSSTAGETKANASLVVLEAGDVVSRVFGNMKGTFDINSPELVGQSANRYPYSPVAMKDLTQAEFANSLPMATMATTAQYSSSIPVLFNNKATEVIDLWTTTGKRTGPRYHVMTSTGITFHANKLVYATGLGDPTVPLKDPASRKFVTDEMNKTQPRSGQLNDVMNVDDFHTVVSTAREMGIDLRSKIKGKTHVVFGQGDGGKITIEEILKIDPEAKIIWVGQPAKTPDEYKASTWERYFGIASKIGNQITTIGDYASTVMRLPDGRFVVNCDKTQTVVQGHILYLATGYAKNYAPSLANLKGPNSVNPSEVQTQKVMLPMEDGQPRTAVAVRVVVGSDAQQDIYVAGPGAGALASQAQLKGSITENPVAIEILGPRTASLARRLVRSSPEQITKLKGAEQQIVQDQLSLSVQSGSAVAPTRAVSELMFKIELTRMLRKVNIDGEAIEIKVARSSGGSETRLTVIGLAPESAQTLIGALKKNQVLLAQLRNLVTEGEVRATIPVNDGRVNAEGILVRLN